ncbi:hypothetical protein [Streptomyces sp. NBC_00199]|uniref:hypothetical protein n=1 Tax=Streptomyces sp. NBC_00199 TaxID=2975678 RepID=UPI00224CAF74|nr:hypothetical protein [Streptomyces sp. NBC_00199]MCX5269412.1 hypothetical protein [Streptomyces sp. NBC_00199]
MAATDRQPPGQGGDRPGPAAAGRRPARTLEALDELGASEELMAHGVKVTRFAVRDGCWLCRPSSCPRPTRPR